MLRVEARDGTFFLGDLPEGVYALVVRVPGAGDVVIESIDATDGVAAITAAAGLAAGIVIARSRALRHCRYDDADALLTLDPGPP